MLDKVSSAQASAISPPPASKSDSANTLTSGSDDNDWFAEAAWSLLGKDAGLHLHYITGYPESSCYAYVAKDPDKRRKPPSHFLRTLFCDPLGRGEPFHEAFMHGCEARWWLDRQRHQRMGAAADSAG